MDGLAEIEQKKYQTVWAHEGYGNYSPGEDVAKGIKLDRIFKRLGVQSILDAGCGSGKTMRFFLQSDPDWFDVSGLDIAQNCLDPWFAEHDLGHILQQGSLWDPHALASTQFDAVVCTDVLEHIPTDKVDDVLFNLRRWSGKITFMGIALFDDCYGPMLLNEPLHLTVKPPEWWRERIEQAGFHVMNQQVTHQGDVPQWLYVMATPI